MVDALKSLVSRKFLLAILVLTFAFVLVLKNFVPADKFLDFATWVIGIFTAGNAVVNTAGIIKSNSSGTSN